MSEFNKLLGEFLDKTITSLDEIATNTEKFIASCTEQGCVPEHPADVARKNFVKENYDFVVEKILTKGEKEAKKNDEKTEKSKKSEKKAKVEEKEEEKPEEEKTVVIEEVKEEEKPEEEKPKVVEEESAPQSQSQRHRRRKHRKTEESK